ncbi:hypothetical protein HPB47_018021, partial [Ixodes persulcatus]
MAEGLESRDRSAARSLARSHFQVRAPQTAPIRRTARVGASRALRKNKLNLLGAPGIDQPNAHRLFRALQEAEKRPAEYTMRKSCTSWQCKKL